MAVEIYDDGDKTIWVNGKEVYLDGDGNWISREELLPSEQAALNDWIRKTGK